MKKYLILAITLVLLILLWVFRGTIFPSHSSGAASDKIRIRATSEQLINIAKEIGGEAVTVESAEQNNKEAIFAADVFLYAGDESDTWANAIAPELANRSIVPVKAKPGNNSGTAQLTADQQRQLIARLTHLFVVLDPTHETLFVANGKQYTTTVR